MGRKCQRNCFPKQGQTRSQGTGLWELYWGLQDPLGFNDLVGGLLGSAYNCIEKNQKREKACGAGPGRSGASFQSLLPMKLHRMCSMQPAMSCDNACEMSQGNSWRPSSRVITGGWSRRHLCPARTKITDSRRRAGAQHKPHCKNSLSPGSHSHQETVGTIPKFKFPDATQGPTLQVSLSKVSSLRPAVLKLPPQNPEMGDMGKMGLDYEK